ncbi:MAG: hypothetical protein K0R82_682 [Flavipsychrobacter sp.]|nr:hypothetical protein [Flavipsychrobacter sp.]
MRNAAKILSLLEARGFSFSFLSEGDVEVHRNFVARNWPNAVTRSNYEYNKWKYGTRANGSVNLLLCKKDRQIIGQIGYIPARLNINGKGHHCVWGCNFKVDDDYKELGIGAALELYAADVFPVILGNTPSADSMKYKKSIGYKFLEGPRVMMYPVKADHLLQLKGRKLPLVVLQVASAVANPVLAAYNTLRLPAQSDEWTPANEARVAERIAVKQNQIAVPFILHDEQFLQWRCNLPAGLREKARLFVYSGDELSYVICSVSGKLLNVYDFSFADRSALRSFIKQVSSIEDISTIRIQANSSEEETLLRRSGFIAFRNKAVITAYSREKLFERFDKMHVDGFDGDIDL